MGLLEIFQLSATRNNADESCEGGRRQQIRESEKQNYEAELKDVKNLHPFHMHKVIWPTVLYKNID